MARKSTVRSDGTALLGIYLNDHLAGSTAGLELLRRVAGALRGTPDGAVLSRLEAEVSADRESLREIMRRLGVGEQRYKLLAGWVGEKVGRLKANGYLIRRSPLSSVLELEAMMLGVRGKAALWRVLHNLTTQEPRLDAAALEELLARADRQGAELDRLRASHAAAAFARPTD